jgi:hypothetical protein
MKPGTVEKVSAAAVGGFGGMFSSLVILASALTRQPESVRVGSWVITFALGLMIWAALGGAVAAIFKETEFKKAFFLGIGLPSLLQAHNIVEDRRKGESAIEAPAQGSTFSLFVAEAYADPQEDRSDTSCGASQPRLLRLYGTEKVQGSRIVFYSADRKSLQSTSLDKFPITGDARSIQVPAFAEGFLLQSDLQLGRVDSNRIRLTAPCTDLRARVEVKNDSWSGFWFALGFTSRPTYDVTVTPLDTKPEPR